MFANTRNSVVNWYDKRMRMRQLIKIRSQYEQTARAQAQAHLSAPLCKFSAFTQDSNILSAQLYDSASNVEVPGCQLTFRHHASSI